MSPFPAGAAPSPERRLEIYRALSAAIEPADRWVVIHSSLAALRLVPERLKWDLLAALTLLVRDGKTLALPTFTFSFCRGQDYHHQRSAGETGQLGNWLLELTDARRTKHPIYSFAVAGPGADELLAAANSTTFGEDSSFALFEQRDARIVMLGCDWTACTQFHRYEEESQVAYRRYHDFGGMADYGEGPARVTARMFVRDEQTGAINDFGPALERLRAAGHIRTAALGDGCIESVGCVPLAKTCRELLAGDRWSFAKPRLRIALLGHSNLELLRRALDESVAEFFPGRSVEIHTVAFGQLLQQMFDSQSDLHRFQPDVVLLVDRLEDLFQVASLDDLRDRADAEEALDHYLAAIEQYLARRDACVFLQKFMQPRPSAHGAADAVDAQGVAALVDRSNRRLAALREKHPTVRLFDPAPTAAAFEGAVFDPRLWHVGRFPFSAAFSQELARRYAGLALAALGRGTRLIVLDLDGTLWGGVLGEDGPEGLQLGGDYPGNAYAEFQHVLKRLSERGIALAVASKNDESEALAALRGLGQMALRGDDFVASRINWRPKPENVIEIAGELRLGLEHVLFVDDNPAERELMRRTLPAVKVLELPDDPALYADALLRCPYLECVERTAEDARRISDYRRRGGAHRMSMRDAHRGAHHGTFGGIACPSRASLGTEVEIAPLDSQNAARAEQLMQKTNQFNTTTRRYRQGRLNLLQAEGDGVYVIAARDRFRDLENIGVLVVRWEQPEADAAEIDSLLLSCRVLGRGIETAVLAWLCQEAKARSVSRLIAPIVVSQRNEPVRDVFQRHGFEPSGEPDVWRLDLARGAVAPPPGITLVDRCRAAA
ncbi:MAG TPA: HAD-IIIC family phosphatase [Pirellulales bacterium]|nr:HAD-IIIC family phosphatase [Pirellulales bacterium]